MRNEAVEKLQEIISESSSIVFFGGAGVSTESGIPDFRSVDGLYHQQWDYPPEVILSHSFFMKKPEEFYRFYRAKMLCEAQPNEAHKKLAALEKTGKLKAVVTQNIDNLHQMAGSKKVLELHGSVYRNHCMKCGAFWDIDSIKSTQGVPRCGKCGGIIKPDVVLYEEALDSRVIQEAVREISQAEVLIIGGTSLSVYPAASLIDYFRGSHLVVINRDPTPRDNGADLVISQPIGEVFGQIQEQ
ncbi:MAG TPA: NAD-dependent protein deacylase [Candidatus Blautia merdigallinarum]|uniref:NAD-dependent protein deacetylase n=1 Tax=Candidatus Blautia merdigallinarum TaxID=2838495 RepID=A0A9D2SKX0_9FIRM|nr:NAD-dependent protein deacylase [Candidatus Blautia merdigallinarum]